MDLAGWGEYRGVAMAEAVEQVESFIAGFTKYLASCAEGSWGSL